MTATAMTVSDRGFLRSYATFVGVAALCALLLAGLGVAITIRMSGSEAVGSMLAGCGVSWLASCVGAIPVATALTKTPSQRSMAILSSTMWRFLTVLILVGPLALSGWLDRTVLVAAVAVSYLVLLLVDTLFAVRMLQRGMD